LSIKRTVAFGALTTLILLVAASVAVPQVNALTKAMLQSASFILNALGDWHIAGKFSVPHSTTLPSGDCSADANTVGRVYQDTDATSGQQWYVCEGAAGWKAQGGGAGGTPGTPALVLGTTNTAGTTGTYMDANSAVAIFSASNPAQLGPSASTGSGAFASRRDHVHLWPKSMQTTDASPSICTLTDNNTDMTLTCSLGKLIIPSTVILGTGSAPAILFPGNGVNDIGANPSAGGKRAGKLWGTEADFSGNIGAAAFYGAAISVSEAEFVGDGNPGGDMFLTIKGAVTGAHNINIQTPDIGAEITLNGDVTLPVVIGSTQVNAGVVMWGDGVTLGTRSGTDVCSSAKPAALNCLTSYLMASATRVSCATNQGADFMAVCR